MIKKIKKCLIVLIIAFFISFLVTFYINRKLKSIIFEMATFEATKLESSIANRALIEILEDDIDINGFYVTKESKDGNIEMIDFNSNLINDFLGKLTIKVQDYLRKIDDGNVDIEMLDKSLNYKEKEYLKRGLLAEVPVGMAFDNVLFANLGPKIPIKLKYSGDVNSNITTKITEYGINNALLELRVNLEIEAKVMLPFVTDKLVLNTDVPIAIKMIQGKIPKYYGGSVVKDSSIYTSPIN